MAAINMGNFNREKFGPVGRCIYCGSDGGKLGLRDEHIFPFFTGGNVELLQASCASCEAITSYLDGYAANNVFHHLRAHKGIQTRRPKARPTGVAIEFLSPNGWTTREVPVQAAPYLLTLPEYDMPGLLAGRQPAEGIEAQTFRLLTNDDTEDRVRKFFEPGETGWRMSTPRTKLDVFARFIAKVGLAAAVAILEYDPSKSFLGPVVRGEEKRIGLLIGCEPRAEKGITTIQLPALPDNSDKHVVGFQYWELDRPPHSRLLGAEVTFFRGHGGITYVAVIGEAMSGAVENRIRPPLQ